MHSVSVASCSLLVFLVIGAETQAQPVSLAFEHFSLSEGLSSYIVTVLQRDTSGYLWVGTQQGLNRYDGARVRTFTRASDTPDGLADDDINALVEDAQRPGMLWIATERGGVSRFDPDTEDFVSFTTATSSIRSNQIHTLYTDLRGVLWVGTDAGLNRYRPSDASFDVIDGGISSEDDTLADAVLALLEPTSTPGYLWIGTDAGLAILDVAIERFVSLSSMFGQAAWPERVIVNAFAETKDAVWIGAADGGLYRYDVRQGHVDPIAYAPPGVSVGNISTLVASKHYPGRLWIGTRGQGLFAFDTHTLAVLQFTHITDVPSSLSQSDVLALHEDQEAGLLWVGTAIGLNKASLLGERFERFAVPGPAVITLYEPPSERGKVWLSILREGLKRYDRSTRTLEPFPISADSLNVIFALHEDRSGNFWLGATYAALFLLDRLTGRVTAYPLLDLENTPIHQIYEAPSQPGVLWIATRRLGLLKFDVASRTVVRQYGIESELPGRLSSNYVWSVHEASGEPGILWIATKGGGVNRLDTHTDSVQVFRHEGAGGCLPSPDVITTASGKEGELWVGMYNAGLVRLNTKDRTCEFYSVENGLAYTDVPAIYKDERERLWMSTSNGLSLFDPIQKAFTTFRDSDGLPSNSFHYQARHRNEKGELFFGGTNGFVVFHPDSIAVQVKPPNIDLTGLRVDGQRIPLKRDSEGKYEPIPLTYNQNDLILEFAALDLRQPAKNRYKVMLEGAEDDWRQIGTQPYERFPLLAPGTYTFRVTGSNSDGYWHTDGVSLPIHIAPPFWKTWWFWLMLTLVGVGLIVAAYQYRIYQLLRVERTRERIADDLHDDIGSKISNVALRLDIAGRDTTLGKGVCRQLAELAQISSEVVDDLRDAVWMVDSRLDNLSSLVARMEQSAEQMIQECDYQFNCPDELPQVALEMEQRRHLYLFYKEALHNAVRHSQASLITIRVAYDAANLSLWVIDNGIGFDMTKPHQGRGLKTLKTRAIQLKANLHFESKPGKGTTMELVTQLA